MTLLKVLISGLPHGALLSAGRRLHEGLWELAPGELRGLRILPA